MLVALLIAPYLRKFGQYTIPDFLGERYGGNCRALLGVAAAILCSFIYVVAQIYGVGLITTRLTGVDFVIGIFLGLGGILVCSFLGGMRAVTWTQVAQYIILIIAYLIPVIWLSVKQTGVPVPQLVYGAQLQKVTEREQQLLERPEGDRGHRDLQGARRGLRGQAAGRAAGAGAGSRAPRSERVAELKAADAPLARHPGGREGAGDDAEERGRGARGMDPRRMPTTKRARGRWPACRRTASSSQATRRATPARAHAYDDRAATSSRWCSA